MRELLEKLPRQYEGALLQVPGAKASDHLNQIAGIVSKTQVTSDAYRPEGKTWSGSIDGPLERMLMQLDEVLTTRAAIPSNRDVNRRFLRDLLPTPDALGAAEEDALLTKWKDLHAFFQAVAHHNTNPSADIFCQRMDECVSFLHERLRVSSTFTAMEGLDAIIAEEETDA